MRVAASETFEVPFYGFETGLVGTCGVRVNGSTDGTRVTSGIVEHPASSGIYLVTMTAPATSGFYRIVFDDGSGDPSGYSIEELVVTASGAPLASGDMFATPDDLGARLGITLTDDEADRAAILLSLATGLIREETNQKISLVEDDTLVLPGRNDDRILLPERPVVSVSSVTVGERELLEHRDWYLDGNTLVRLGRSEILPAYGGWPESHVIRGWGFGQPFRDITIVYTHGFTDIPSTVRAICLAAVARVWINPEAVVSQTIGGVQTSYAMRGFEGGGGSGGVEILLTSPEKAQLRRAIGHTVAGSIQAG